MKCTFSQNKHSKTLRIFEQFINASEKNVIPKKEFRIQTSLEFKLKPNNIIVNIL